MFEFKTLRRTVALGVAVLMLASLAGVPAHARWRDNSPGGSDDTFVYAGGAVAIGGIIWAVVRHKKKKRLRKLEQTATGSHGALNEGGECV